MNEDDYGDLSFFRGRSSSDSLAMGNKSSAIIKSRARPAWNPRPETEQPAAQLPEATGCPSSPCQQQQPALEKSPTSETLFVDAGQLIDEESSEERSSYKEVAHHHTWTCEDNLIFASEYSDSVNAPDLPFDSNTTDVGSLTFDEDARTCLFSCNLVASEYVPDDKTSPCSSDFFDRTAEVDLEQVKLLNRQPDKYLWTNFSSEEYSQHLLRAEYLSLETLNSFPRANKCLFYDSAIVQFYTSKYKSVSIVLCILLNESKCYCFYSSA